MPYLRLGNLAETMKRVSKLGYDVIGLDAEGAEDVGPRRRPVAVVLGAEGPGLRVERTRETLRRRFVRVPARGGLRLAQRLERGRAVALYAVTRPGPAGG